MASSGELDGGESGEGMGKISEYEKQRFARIAENKARLEALGISKAAKALVDSTKPNSGEEDDDYRPGEADGDEDEDFVGNSGKRKTSASKRKLLSKKNLNTSKDDDDLDKAIALSLAGGSRFTHTKKEFMTKTLMTQDQLLLYFYQFDDAGKGFITLTDVAKMASLHDFTWTQEDLQDMIRCFDIDKDGKLSLDEFTMIVTRCRMFKQS